MICVTGVRRSILVIFYCIIVNLGYRIEAFRIPGVQDLLELAEVFPQSIATQTPAELSVTTALCHLKTVNLQKRFEICTTFACTVQTSKRFSSIIKQNELIEYYGYIAEQHTVTTEDGYILTVFRCNSKKSLTQPHRKAVIVQHGLLASSDDFCINDPSQSLGKKKTFGRNKQFVYSFACHCVIEWVEVCQCVKKQIHYCNSKVQQKKKTKYA